MINGSNPTVKESLISKDQSELAGVLVKIQDYNPSNHSLKIVRLDTGMPVYDKIDTGQEQIISKPFDQPSSKSLKTLPAPDAPILEVNDMEASVRGSATTGFFSTRQFGNIMKGPISFDAQPEEMRFAGLMTFHPLLLSGFPSTIVTPVPTFQWSLPSGSMLGPIVKDVSLMATLLGAL